MNIRTTLLFFLISCLHNQAYSENSDSIINHIFCEIYGQQFEKADSLILNHENHIDKFYYNVLRIDLLWWKYSTTRSKKDARILNDVLNNSGISNSQNEEMNRLISKSYQLRYYRKKHNLIRVIDLRSDANSLIGEINVAKLPLNKDQLKLFDLYITMFQYFENLNLFSFQKNTSEGKILLLKMEEFASDKDLILSTMAHYFLGRIYQKIENDPIKGKRHFEILITKFPKNTIFLEYYSDCERRS